MAQTPLHKGFSQSFEIKDFDKKSGTFVQAYTRYDVKDSDADYGRKGMFTKTWSENFSRIRHLLNHDVDRPIGAPQKFWDDSEYAYIESQIANTTQGEDFKKMVDSQLIKEASYGYTVIKSNKLKDGQELLEVKLWEVSSLTGWGANEFTPVISFQKGMNMGGVFEDYLDRYSNLQKFIKDTDATDETIKDLIVERDNIKSFLKGLIKSTEAVVPEATLQPPSVKGAELLSLNLSLQKQYLKLQNI